MRNGIKWLLALFGQDKAKEALLAWKDVFNVEDEKVSFVLIDLAKYCNFSSSSFVAADAQQTAFNEGARDVFLHILEMSEINVHDILKILNSEHYK